MSQRLLIRTEAHADVEEAARWYEDQRRGLGEVFYRQVSDLIGQVAESPLRFPLVAPTVRRGLVQRFPYALYFVVDESAIVILAVLHQRRDPQVWERRR
jgi:plasmid stabilization system protein ParE